MKNLEQLRSELLADGIIDASEAFELRKLIFADGVIDTEEAEFLFDLNDAVSGEKNAQEWESLFIEAITSYLLEDEKSPGIIDDEEAKWLFDQFSGDGQLDELEKKLLFELKAKAKNFPSILQTLLP